MTEQQAMQDMKACAWCGTLFQPKRKWARFHNARCRRQAFEADRVRRLGTEVVDEIVKRMREE